MKWVGIHNKTLGKWGFRQASPMQTVVIPKGMWIETAPKKSHSMAIVL
jgi:hypothetical protein